MRDYRLRWREMLPIVTRELRVAAKRRSTYRLRFIVALVGAAQLILAATFLAGFSVQVGQALFWLTSIVATLLCAGSGLVLTADSISREKREGTLGLLFLTRLTSLDIVLGKFTAGFLSGGSVAFAVFPFLAFSLSMGGVTAQEFWTMSALLFVLLIFSLILGIFISTIFRRESTVAFIFIFAMFLPVATLPLAIMKWNIVPLFFARWNPLFPILSQIDSFFNQVYFQHEHVIPTLFFQFFLAFAMLALSCFILPSMIRSQSRPIKPTSIPIARKIRRISRRSLLDSNPVLWLSARQNHPLLLLYLCIALRLIIGFFTTVPFEAEVTYIFLLAILPKLFVLWHASGMMVEERQSGFLEAVLTTPIAASEILDGKTRAIKRQVYPVLLFALAVQWATSTQWWAAAKEIPVSTTVVLAVMITVLIDVHSVGWIGLWQGLLARDRRRALIRSFIWGVIIPWMPAALGFGIIAFIFEPRWLDSPLNTLPPTLISANIISFALSCFGMARLHDNFRSTATQNWSAKAPA
jgi:ABC-type transport system involved in multi-copper enzyme maturation permease subunit